MDLVSLCRCWTTTEGRRQYSIMVYVVGCGGWLIDSASARTAKEIDRNMRRIQKLMPELMHRGGGWGLPLGRLVESLDAAYSIKFGGTANVTTEQP